MASVEYQNSILWRGEDPSKRKFKPKYDNSHKVERYFPGQKPRWAAAEEEDVVEATLEEVPVPARRKSPPRTQRRSSVRHTPAPEPEEIILHSRTGGLVLKKEEIKDDDDEEDKEEVKVAVKPAVKEEVKEEEDDDPEVQGLVRAKRRELALLKRQAEEKALRESMEEVHAEPDEESSSEYESVTDEEAVARNRTMLKPVFVPQSKRETVKEKENIQKEEEQQKAQEKENLKKRKLESKDLLLDHIKKDDEAEKAAQEDLFASDVELPDDDDEKNEAEEYDLWKIRELKRIKREREERATRQKEIEFIERRRNMTDEERAAEDAKLDALANKKEDSKNFGFLQKYYHRGGYFQDKAVSGEEPLYLRDYHQPLEEEKYDKNLLPKAMQVRRGLFGKKGQVKHTHLTEVDTTDFSASWSQGGKMVQKYQMKMAGAKGVNNFDRPGLRGV